MLILPGLALAWATSRRSFCRKRRVRDHHQREIDQSGNRRDISQQVERKRLEQRDVDGRGRRNEQQRVTVGGRIDHRLDGNIAAGARLVLDHDGWPSRSDNHGAMIRETMSAPPPAGNPTPSAAAAPDRLARGRAATARKGGGAPARRRIVGDSLIRLSRQAATPRRHKAPPPPQQSTPTHDQVRASNISGSQSGDRRSAREPAYLAWLTLSNPVVFHCGTRDGSATNRMNSAAPPEPGCRPAPRRHRRCNSAGRAAASLRPPRLSL